MKKIIYINKLLLLIVCFWGASACTEKFVEINTNPNSPTTDKGSPSLLLASVIENMTDGIHGIGLGHEIGSCWAQHMAKCQYTDEDRYVFRPDGVNANWNRFYAATGQDLAVMYKISDTQLHDNFKGVALVLQVYLMSVLTDVFGNIPYTEAFKGDAADGGILNPKYDTQESIYRDLVAKLKQANTLLKTDGKAIAGDILFGNDITKWKKFANSLRLRLLLRMSAKDAAFVTTEMQATLATGPIFTSNADNAALIYLGSQPNNNPLNENYVKNGRDDHRVSEHFINMLLNDYSDYRIMVYAKPSSGTDEFIGIPNGLNSSDAAVFNGNGLANTSKISDYFLESTAPGMLMSYAELQFILAEAAKKGFIAGGDATAKAYYNAGITASYNQYRTFLQGIFDTHVNDSYGGISLDTEVEGEPYTVDEVIDSYINDTESPAFYNPAKALQQIAEQRYIATFDQGLQTWFEWRRTGYPVLTPALAGTNGGKIPVRLPYPTNEASTNQANLKQAVTSQGADDLNTRVWWDVD